MNSIRFRISLLYVLSAFLLLIGTDHLSGQDREHYSAFRNEFFKLAIDYKLDEALALCNSADETDMEVLAAKSIVYSLMGNSDKDEELVQKGFKLVKPYKGKENDYNIHVALAVSYGMQANHSGLKEKAEFSKLSVGHCKEALKLRPDLPHPNFILGRFYFELSKMSKLTADVAKTVIGKEEIERASFDLALSYLRVASKVAPNRFLYNYYTGAAYEKLGNEKKAQEYFHLANKNVRHIEDDHKAYKKLQKKLK